MADPDVVYLVAIPRAERSVYTLTRDGAQVQLVAFAGLGEGIKSTGVTIGTSATPLPQVPLLHRKSINVENHGAKTVYVGDSDVAAVPGGGMKVAPGASRSFDIAEGVTLYGVVDDDTSVVNVFEGA